MIDIKVGDRVYLYEGVNTENKFRYPCCVIRLNTPIKKTGNLTPAIVKAIDPHIIEFELEIPWPADSICTIWKITSELSHLAIAHKDPRLDTVTRASVSRFHKLT